MKYISINKDYDELILNIKKYFSNVSNKVLFDKRNIIKVVEFKDEKYVVKSFKIPHLLNKFIYRFFRASKAKRSYENSHKLLELEVNTPCPIGYVECNTLLFFLDSYYVSEFLDYDFEIRAVFSDKNFKDRDTILKEFIAFSCELHDKNVYHIDYSPGNILIKIIDNKYIFYIIDVNRMKFIEFDLDLRMKSMSKLTSDSEDGNKMMDYYAHISGIDKDSLIERYDYYIEEQKRYLANKKKMKQFIKKKSK
jgi:serine/threonine protein kinase